MDKRILWTPLLLLTWFATAHHGNRIMYRTRFSGHVVVMLLDRSRPPNDTRRRLEVSAA